MSKENNQDILQSMATELAKNLKTEKDLSALSRELVKLTVETALGKEMEEHLGYAKHSPEGRGSGNSRNGSSKKTLKGQMGEKAVAADLKRIYQSITAEEAEIELKKFGQNGIAVILPS